MILELKKIKPFIHFGFNRQTLTAEVAQDVVVWQDTIYNKEEYELSKMNIIASGDEIIYKDFNKIILRFNTTGKKNIAVQMESDKDLESNIIEVNIV